MTLRAWTEASITARTLFRVTSYAPVATAYSASVFVATIYMMEQPAANMSRRVATALLAVTILSWTLLLLAALGAVCVRCECAKRCDGETSETNTDPENDQPTHRQSHPLHLPLRISERYSLAVSLLLELLGLSLCALIAGYMARSSSTSIVTRVLGGWLFVALLSICALDVLRVLVFGFRQPREDAEPSNPGRVNDEDSLDTERRADTCTSGKCIPLAVMPNRKRRKSATIRNGEIHPIEPPAQAPCDEPQNAQPVDVLSDSRDSISTKESVTVPIYRQSVEVGSCVASMTTATCEDDEETMLSLQYELGEPPSSRRIRKSNSEASETISVASTLQAPPLWE